MTLITWKIRTAAYYETTSYRLIGDDSSMYVALCTVNIFITLHVILDREGKPANFEIIPARYYIS